MSRRPAIFTQADVARAIRAAKQTGAAIVEVRPDGAILVHLQDKQERSADVDSDREIML